MDESDLKDLSFCLQIKSTKWCINNVGGDEQVLSLTYEYKAIPTQEQVQMIEHTLTVCRKVWNYALRTRKDWINSRKCQVNACSITSEYIMSADAPRPTYAQSV